MNNAPVATDDIAITSIFSTKAIDVLANDKDADGDHKIITQVTTENSSNDIGTIAIENNQLVYNAGAAPGDYTFTYTVEDEDGDSDTGTLTITVVVFSD